jgi:drug/metabolite transporter (DMT)-like permease
VLLLGAMSRRGWFAFAAMSSIWGVPYLFIKIAVDGGAPPAGVAFARVALAAVVLLSLASRAGTLAPLRGRMRWVALYGIVEIALPFPLIAFGEQRMPSSLAAILIASVPLMIAVLSLRFAGAERPTAIRMAGLLIGFAGVVTLVGVDVSNRPGELPGVLAVLGAAAGYAVGPLVLERHLVELDPRATMGASLAVAAAVLALPAALTAPAHAPSAGAIASIVVLGLLCTALAFVIFNVLIAEAGPARASVITYLNPVVAVGLGVLLLGEQPDAGTVAGLLLVLAGSWLSTGGRLPPGLLSRLGRAPRRPSADAPGWTRTSNHRLRRPVLYPVELQGPATILAAGGDGRGAGARGSRWRFKARLMRNL